VVVGREEPLGVRQALTERPSVSIVIPHFDDLVRLDVCLDLLMLMDGMDSNTEVIVCDNGTPAGLDAVIAVVKGRARVVSTGERGAGPARNEAVRHAKGEVLAFLDSDCEPQSGWMQQGVAALGENDIVGGKILVSVADPENLTIAEAFERVFAFKNQRYVHKIGFTVTASMFVWRRVFNSVGDFHNFVPEDIEWCERARAQGYKIGYAEQCILVHPARHSLDDLRRKWARMLLESLAMYRQKNRSELLWMLRNWLVLLSIFPHLYNVATSSQVSGVRNRFKAAAGLFYIRTYRFLYAHKVFFKGKAA